MIGQALLHAIARGDLERVTNARAMLEVVRQRRSLGWSINLLPFVSSSSLRYARLIRCFVIRTNESSKLFLLLTFLARESDTCFFFYPILFLFSFLPCNSTLINDSDEFL